MFRGYTLQKYEIYWNLGGCTHWVLNLKVLRIGWNSARMMFWVCTLQKYEMYWNLGGCTVGWSRKSKCSDFVANWSDWCLVSPFDSQFDILTPHLTLDSPFHSWLLIDSPFEIWLPIWCFDRFSAKSEHFEFLDLCCAPTQISNILLFFKSTPSKDYSDQFSAKTEHF